MANLTRDECVALVQRERPQAQGRTLCVPVGVRLLADHLTPVVAYRRLVAPDEREAPSFLLESVEGGERQGRYSILGAQPVREVVARGHEVTTKQNETAASSPVAEHAESRTLSDPLALLSAEQRRYQLVRPAAGPSDPLPACFLGGWVGYAGYDSVRYAEPQKLRFSAAPRDDRGLPDLHFGFYSGVVAFDHVAKVVHVVELAFAEPDGDAGAAYDHAIARVRSRVEAIERHSEPLRGGEFVISAPAAPLPSNMSRQQHAAMLAKAKEFIRAGDIFQVVVGQRFERTSRVDPFDVYRALRCVNPSPYMVYMQAPGCILVASSPEILCRVRKSGEGFVVTNRPLAGTRRRGATPEEDVSLERELLSDAKERAEHIMLVDLGRNDVGVVARPGTVTLDKVMEVERYSHVMHISSTVTGTLRDGLDCWDALRAALPVGTISGAPKVRAMQIIDELEPVRRGPYGGGMGYVGLDGQMDIALTLRTIVTPTALSRPDGDKRSWTYHLQAAGGIVADSVAQDEYMETVNKAAALARAIEVAERAFGA
ncbi:MAG TPA: anthranilate synthase component I [Phycisphaerales bacterium]|nr:anthranilate synthase component I [Phycisphaerales bacterium]